MSFSAISLDKVGTPQIIGQPPAEQIFEERKQRLLELAQGSGDAEYVADVQSALSLESELLVQLLQEDSWREMVLRQDVQDAGLGNMLAFATGPALDHLAAFFGVSRQIVQAADDTASPPIPEILESDDRLRQRAQLAPEGYTTAGSIGAYTFWALTSAPQVKSVEVLEDAPSGEVHIAVLSMLGDGTPDNALLTTVQTALSAEVIRPLCDTVVVQAATILSYQINAVLALYPGPGAEVVRQEAEKALAAYVDRNHRLGHDITVAGLHAALYVEGVQNVDLGAFADDLIVGTGSAAHCSEFSVSIGGRDV